MRTPVVLAERSRVERMDVPLFTVSEICDLPPEEGEEPAITLGMLAGITIEVGKKLGRAGRALNGHHRHDVYVERLHKFLKTRDDLKRLADMFRANYDGEVDYIESDGSIDRE